MDLPCHLSYQLMLPEAIAIVCALKHDDFRYLFLENIMECSVRLVSTITTSSGSRAFKVAVERAKDQIACQTCLNSPETAPFEVSILADGINIQYRGCLLMCNLSEVI